jgi:nucleoside-diphosphate-sugar epimerase
MNGSELHAVLGASGGTGSAVVRELVRRGYRVRAVNRRGDAEVPEGVERRAGDASTPGAPAPRSRGLRWSTTPPSPHTRGGPGSSLP